MKKRLDILLLDKGLVNTRSKASCLIKEGYILVNGKKYKKRGMLIEENSNIEIIDSPFIYVSRAGVKLKKAIDEFGINLKNKICLDVGSSTGGFSDCMLKEGAKMIYAVDVGTNQMHKTLKNNERIILLENTDIRSFKSDILFDFVSIDVSFISLQHILPYIKILMKKDSSAIALIKPQFEVGPKMTKKGIVKNTKLIENAIKDIQEFSLSIGLYPINVIKSPILGKDGNKEYLIFLKPKHYLYIKD